MNKTLYFTAILAILTTLAMPAAAGESVSYHDGDTALEGYWAPSACADPDKAPVVMIVHQWLGLGAYEKMRADMLAEKCYNAFAVDMYGKDSRPAGKSEAGKLAGRYKSDPPLARRRINAALAHVRSRADADSARVAAIGYCFGGTMALELARSGADIDGAVSFHGGLSTPAPVGEPGVIKASIQVHHGADDPHVPPAEVEAFMKEMNAADADWHLTYYSGAVHSFTHKDAGNDPSTGAAYDEKADRRSWNALLDFLVNTLGQ